MKYDAKGETLARANRTNPMLDVRPIESTGAFGRPVARCNDCAGALRERNDATDRLRSWLLLDQQKLTSGELDVWFAQANDDLEWKED
jgi:hypothetical protein